MRIHVSLQLYCVHLGNVGLCCKMILLNGYYAQVNHIFYSLTFLCP